MRTSSAQSAHGSASPGSACRPTPVPTDKRHRQCHPRDRGTTMMMMMTTPRSTPGWRWSARCQGQLKRQSAGHGNVLLAFWWVICKMLAICWGDAWCNGQHVCFPSLPPMLLCGFESRLGLESSGFSMWHFLKFVARGFFRVLWFLIQPIK